MFILELLAAPLVVTLLAWLMQLGGDHKLTVTKGKENTK